MFNLKFQSRINKNPPPIVQLFILKFIWVHFCVVEADTTGENSIYTIYEGHEIMFHVSTLLPYTKDSKQQLERKRHIGNDIVTVVFQDLDNDNDEPDFTPSSARSQFQHIFALVTHNKETNSYRLKIYSEQSVPPFGPALPCPSIFTNFKEFREFLLVKCNDSYIHTPHFLQYIIQ